MIFSSSLFLLYFLPTFLIVYYLIPRNYRNWVLLITSIFFYAWGAPKFVFFVMGSVLVDFVLIRQMSLKTGSLRRALFWISVALNLTLLLYFKYMNFFVDQFQIILTWFGSKPSEWTKIALPVGISFITFQKLSYALDVFKRKHPVFDKLQDFALYIFMFPQLLSGPIVRPGQIASQIADRSQQENIDFKLSGFYRFIIGLAKKMLIADVLGVTVNEIFAMKPDELSTGLTWVGTLAYTFQIYFDFSGYSDMAIGLARMLGFKLPENFNTPYVSQSITEFWRRWHMTLSFWFRDYIFLPLAYATSRRMPKERYLGLRTDKVIYLIATTVTFLLCGFWHGAAWTFIFWGIYMGIFLIIDRLFLLKWMKKIGRIPSVAITFFVLMMGWLLFRSQSLDEAWFLIRRLFVFQSDENLIWLNQKFWTILAIAVFFSFWGGSKKVEAWIEKLYFTPGNGLIISFSIIAILLCILCVATITASGFSPFIYFRF
ncbi:MAG: MBOAT family protein [Bacteroidales bacterium]|jgi:alginate O-acetyltransferase complex protein AlgI|nr:MBOAT family protein [Bacteroidales bacterium]